MNFNIVDISFGEMLEWIRSNNVRAYRKGWNGKNQFIYYVPEGAYKPCTNIAEHLVNEQGLVEYSPYIALKTVQGNVVPWTPSITDILANDWRITE